MDKNRFSMAEMFKGYTKYSDDEYKKIWKDSIIVIDTNVLLNLYRYSEDVRKMMLDIFERINERLWIPYQVGKEFFDNKTKVMLETCKEYDNLSNIIITSLKKAKNEINQKKDNRLKCKDKINEIINDDIEKIEELLKEEQKEKTVVINNDNIEKVIIKLFDNNIGMPFNKEEYIKVKEEGIRRMKNNIPPGYKDKNKEENGDYYIFYSMIKKAKQEKKDIIFVTDDEKEDWFHKYNGKNHGGRHELLNEFYKETNQLLLIYTTDGFVQSYNKNITKMDVDKKLIIELKQVKNNNHLLNSSLTLFDELIKLLDYSHHDLSEMYDDIDYHKILRCLDIAIRSIKLPISEEKEALEELMTIEKNYKNKKISNYDREKIIYLFEKIRNIIEHQNIDIESILDSYRAEILAVDLCIDEDEYNDICNKIINNINNHLAFIMKDNKNFNHEIIEELKKISLMVREKQILGVVDRKSIISVLETLLKKYN